MAMPTAKQPFLRLTKYTAEEILTFLLFFTSGYLFLAALFLASPGELWRGFTKILVSPAGLVTDYFELVGIGSAMLNASVITLLTLLLIKGVKAKLSGVMVAAVFTMAGFAFFGKNLYNSTPIILGTLIYAKSVKQPFRNHLVAALFGTSLGPLVSEISFSMGLPLGRGVFLGCLMGLTIGYIIPVAAVRSMAFHKGFNLYNIGFTAGAVGTMVVSVMRGFGVTFEPRAIIAAGNNLSMESYLFVFFGLLLGLGILLNGGTLDGYGRVLKESGKAGTDFLDLAGLGLTLVNMAFLGALMTAYILFVGGELNGPAFGAIFTVLGFGAYGKHVANVLPITLGVFFMARIGHYDVTTTAVIFAATFGTALAPIAGTFGPLAGFLAGMVHLNLVANVGYLHGGMNLYNNGFSAGMVAAFLVPALESLHLSRKKGLNRDTLVPPR